MWFSTTDYYDYSLYIVGKAYSPLVAKQPIRLTVCNNVLTVIGGQPDYIYWKNSHGGISDDIGTPATWFSGYGNNCGLPAEPYSIRRADGSAYSGGLVYIEPVTHRIRTNTLTPFREQGLRVYVTTNMGVRQW